VQFERFLQEDKNMEAGYLIDMDGVIYRGSELIPGADKFVMTLRDGHSVLISDK